MIDQIKPPYKAKIEPGSFRDRHGRIIYSGGSVYRGISELTLQNWNALIATKFFQPATEQNKLVQTIKVEKNQLSDISIGEGWAAVLKHQVIPFISYPYEWSFGMMKDAALLQLELLEKAIKEDMTMKDATSFNIQWFGANPVFIDIASFENLNPGTPWVGYRQFCEMFLYPLMLQAYKNIHFHPWMRGSIDGIDPEEFNNLMSCRDMFRRGVFVDVYLQSKLQKKYATTTKKVKDDIKSVGFRKEMILSNIRRLTKIVNGLNWKQSKSEWSDYADDNSYSNQDAKFKDDFVRDAVRCKDRNLVWDLGCNTGRFSRIAAEHSKYVVAMDSDHLAIERLYQELKRENCRTILPLVMNLSDASPNLGWRGLERKSLAERGKPDLILALALIHHVVISANIPLAEFIDWLASLGGDLIIEFVTKEDPMVKFLLQNKEDQYNDYELENFEQQLALRFNIVKRLPLNSRTRYLVYGETRINE
ncbi:MAG: class I SAM-dependent methyltransferase [Ignavibacteriales bacterium]|nr:class I SAM-dependent methyltransferase [Ignavibacteriales bacterium]